MIRPSDHAAIVSLNIVQGLPTYFFTLGLPALMREAGASLDVIALTYVVWLPWALKWLWAPWFDRPVAAPFGSRPSWMRWLPTLMACCFALLTLVPFSGASASLFAVAFACSMVGATLQVVLSAWIIDRFTENERAMANAMQIAGMTAGSVIGGAVLLVYGETLSEWSGTLLVAAFILAVSMPAWLVKGDASCADRQNIALSYALTPWRALAPGFPQVMVLMIGAGIVAGMDVLLPAFLVDRGFTAADTGWIIGMLAMIAVIPASAVGGMLAGRIGPRRSLSVLFPVKAILLGAFAFTDRMPSTLAAILCILSFAVGGAIIVAYWQLYMRLSSTTHAATAFGFLTSLEALLLMAAGMAAGMMAEALGYGPAFTLAAAAALLCTIMALVQDRMAKRAEA